MARSRAACYGVSMAIVTVPVVVASILAYRYIKKRRRRGGALKKESGLAHAALALTAFPPHTAEQIMKQLPPPVARALALATTELPAIQETNQRKALCALQRELGDQDLDRLDPTALAAGIIKLMLKAG